MLLINWWKDLSVSKKLYGIVGVLAIIIALELFTLLFAMQTLSAVRAFVGGEGLWSKSQKDAVYNLQRYAFTHREDYYRLFQENLKVPMGDHQARLELSKPEMNLEIVIQGFVSGKVHPNDVLPMVKLVRRFHQVHYLAKAIDIWTQADERIFKLIDLADLLHRRVDSDPKNTAQINAILEEISEINTQLTLLEDDFSSTLGEASRWLERVLMMLLVLAVATAESTGLILTAAFSRSLTKVIREIGTVAAQVGAGDFSQKVPVRSRDELGLLAASLNRMINSLEEQTSERREAERANHEKSLFLANMSHEIRTPLNAILGFTELLRDPNLSQADRVAYLDVVKRTGVNLTTVINDILDLSKVEAGQIKIENTSFSLKHLLNDLYMLLKMRCQERGIELDIVHPPHSVSECIVSDPIRLRQILLNVIGNAIKFTAKGSVQVSYEVLRAKLKFTIKDTGMGIPADQVSRLFKPFSQVDSSLRRKFGGTGLGLVLSKNLAFLLGGDVRLEESSPGVGSTFVIEISYEPTSSSQQNTSFEEVSETPLTENELQALKGKKILLVEDSVDNQTLVKLYLSKTGAEIDIANNGAEGLKMATETKYELVLMDMQMPVMDGYEATFELRKRGIYVPVIALTAHAMKEDRERCLRAGCDEYISKPMDPQRLVRLALKCIVRKPSAA